MKCIIVTLAMVLFSPSGHAKDNIPPFTTQPVICYTGPNCTGRGDYKKYGIFDECYKAKNKDGSFRYLSVRIAGTKTCGWMNVRPEEQNPWE